MLNRLKRWKKILSMTLMMCRILVTCKGLAKMELSKLRITNPRLLVVPDLKAPCLSNRVLSRVLYARVFNEVL